MIGLGSRVGVGDVVFLRAAASVSCSENAHMVLAATLWWMSLFVFADSVSPKFLTELM